MVQWSLIDLKNTISNLYGAEQVKLISPSLESIFQNQDFARYHYSELNRLVEEHFEGLDDDQDYLKLILTNDVDVRNKEHDYGIAYKANIMALLKNLHSISDLLAHAIYFALGLNLKEKTEINPKYLNLKKVIDKLANIDGASDLVNDLNALTSHEDNIYLNSLVNHSKHRSNISPNLSYELAKTGVDSYKFSFQEFDYDEVSYGSKLVKPFLNNMYNYQSESIIKIGNKINTLAEVAC